MKRPQLKAPPQPVRWDQSALAPWRAALPPERLERDKRDLARLFNLAAQVPMLQDALDWAQAHGIEFIVDRSCKAGGYYNVGTGVVAIAESSLADTAYAVGALVHEIRHAWQDYYGMIPTTGTGFTSYFMRLSAIEADAMSQEFVAREQYHVAKWEQALERMRDYGLPAVMDEERMKQRMQATLGPQEQWTAFRGWYTDRADYYGSHALKVFGKRFGVPGVEPPDNKFEFRPYEGKPVPKLEGLDIQQPGQLRRLGKSFNGKNYFDAANDDALLEQMRSPRLAADFFKAGGQPLAVRDLAAEVRRRELRLKRHRGHAVLV